MRELIFKNLTSDNKRRRDIFISEAVEDDGIKTVTKRHSVYIVEERSKISGPEDISKFQANPTMDVGKRHVFIVKERDTKGKKDTFVCDVVGKFYTIVNEDIYLISFKHSFEVDFLYMTDSKTWA